MMEKETMATEKMVPFTMGTLDTKSIGLTSATIRARVYLRQGELSARGPCGAGPRLLYYSQTLPRARSSHRRLRARCTVSTPRGAYGESSRQHRATSQQHKAPGYLLAIECQQR